MSTSGQEWAAVRRGAAFQVGGALAMIAVRSLGLLLRAVFGGTEYGLFVIVFSLVELLAYLAISGFVDSIVVYASRWLPGSTFAGDLSESEREDRLYRALATCIGVPVLLGLGLAIAIQIVAPWMHRTLWNQHDVLIVDLVRLLAWSLPMLVLMQLPVEAIKAHLRWGWSVAIVQVLFPVLSLVAGIGSHLLFDRGIVSLVDGVLFALAVCIPLSLHAFNQHFRVARLLRYLVTAKWDRDVAQFALPQGFNMALNQGLVRVDTLVLSAFISASAVGVYSLVSELTQLIRLAKLSISGVYSPLAARLHAAGQRETLRDALERMAVVTSWLSIPLLLTIMGIFPVLVLHEGEAWVGSPWYPWLLCVGPMMSCFFGLAGNTLLMTGHPRLLLLNAIISGLLNLILNLILVPRAGLLGAAIATAVANFTISMLQVIELSRLERLSFRSALYARTVLAAILPAIVMAIAGEPTGTQLAAWLAELPALAARSILVAGCLALFGIVYAVLPGPSALAVWRGAEISRKPA